MGRGCKPKFNIQHDGPGGVSSAQRKLQDALANSSNKNTIDAQGRIAYESLIAGGADKQYARYLVEYAIVDMYAHGVTTPTRVPWH